MWVWAEAHHKVGERLDIAVTEHGHVCGRLDLPDELPVWSIAAALVAVSRMHYQIVQLCPVRRLTGSGGSPPVVSQATSQANEPMHTGNAGF